MLHSSLSPCSENSGSYIYMIQAGEWKKIFVHSEQLSGKNLRYRHQAFPEQIFKNKVQNW